MPFMKWNISCWTSPRWNIIEIKFQNISKLKSLSSGESEGTNLLQKWKVREKCLSRCKSVRVNTKYGWQPFVWQSFACLSSTKLTLMCIFGLVQCALQCIVRVSLFWPLVATLCATHWKCIQCLLDRHRTNSDVHFWTSHCPTSHSVSCTMLDPALCEYFLASSSLYHTHWTYSVKHFISFHINVNASLAPTYPGLYFLWACVFISKT